MSEDKAVYIVKAGCPICRSDIRGNKKYKFFCRQCNVLFDFWNPKTFIK